jgi:hypothetical protein
MVLLALRIIPNAMLTNNIEVPPRLTIGSANPVTGNKLTATPIFINAWTTRLKDNPIAKRAASGFSVSNTILNERYNKSK